MARTMETDWSGSKYIYDGVEVLEEILKRAENRLDREGIDISFSLTESDPSNQDSETDEDGDTWFSYEENYFIEVVLDGDTVEDVDYRAFIAYIGVEGSGTDYLEDVGLWIDGGYWEDNDPSDIPGLADDFADVVLKDLKKLKLV